MDTSDSSYFETYLDQLLQPEYLCVFGWTCFAEESQFDDFQARLLQSMCELYISLNKGEEDFEVRNDS